MDVHKYVRRINVKRHFASITAKPGELVQHEFQHSGLANASTFNPPGVLAPSLKVFRDVVLRDLESIKVTNQKMEKKKRKKTWKKDLTHFATINK